MTMIAASMCLLGVNCTYCGSHNAFKPMIDLFAAGKVIPICPEQLGGLSTPRIPAEIRNGRVIDRTGRDVTDAFETGAREADRLISLAGCRCAVLKSRSPSCGVDFIYDGTFSHKTVPGDGMLAGLLKRRNMKLVTEETFDPELLKD